MIRLAVRKWDEASVPFTNLSLMWLRTDECVIPEPLMEVLLELGPRLSRCLPEFSCALPLNLAKVHLGILSAAKDDPAALKRSVALLGEAFPAMLREYGPVVDGILPTRIGYEGITA